MAKPCCPGRERPIQVKGCTTPGKGKSCCKTASYCCCWLYLEQVKSLSQFTTGDLWKGLRAGLQVPLVPDMHVIALNPARVRLKVQSMGPGAQAEPEQAQCPEQGGDR